MSDDRDEVINCYREFIRDLNRAPESQRIRERRRDILDQQRKRRAGDLEDATP